MDFNIYKYRFSKLLSLFATCYGFGTNTDPPEFVFTTCQYVRAWFEQTGSTLTYYERNMWIVNEMTTIAEIRNQLSGYYVATNNKCDPFL